MRFGLFEPIIEDQVERERREKQLQVSKSCDTPASTTPNLPSVPAVPTSRTKGRKGGKKVVKHPSPQIDCIPTYQNSVLCAGNERSRFFFWDLDVLETTRSSSISGTGSSLARGSKRKRAVPSVGENTSSPPTSTDSLPSASLSFRSLRAVRVNRSLGGLADSPRLGQGYRVPSHPRSITTSSAADSPSCSTPALDAASRDSGTHWSHSGGVPSRGHDPENPPSGTDPSIRSTPSLNPLQHSSSGLHHDDGDSARITNSSTLSATNPTLTSIITADSTYRGGSPVSSISSSAGNTVDMVSHSVQSSGTLQSTHHPADNPGLGISVVPPSLSTASASIGPGAGIGHEGATSTVSSIITGIAADAGPTRADAGSSRVAPPSPAFRSPISDPAVPIAAHRTHTVSKINFVVRQVAWSVGGEWCIGCGDLGVLVVFGRP